MTARANTPPSPDAIRRAAHDILSRPEFHTAPDSSLTRLRRWAADQITHAINAVLNGHIGIAGAILAVAVVAALVVIIVRVARGTTPNPVRGWHQVGGTRRSTSDWLADAAACEARGDFRGAMRGRYRALLADLASRGLVEEIAERTTGEYRAAVSAAVPAIDPDFSQATEMFERIWYGDDVAGREEADRFRAVADRVMTGSR